MKYRTCMLFISMVGVLWGCSDDEEKRPAPNLQASIVERDSPFASFVAQVPELDSSFSWSNSDTIEYLDIKSKFIPERAGLIGRLPSIDNYSFLIYSYPADTGIPILEVYNEVGEKVNQRELFVMGDCPSILSLSDSHHFHLSADRSTVYMSTSCAISFSAGFSDSLVVGSLIYR